MARTILHVDLDAFFCAVEALLDPDLVGKAFVVGGRPETRGVVSSASYPARKFGVRSAMAMAQAVRLCPKLIIVPPRHRIYSEHSKQVMQVLKEAAPLFEQISIDEAFLDVSDDPRTGIQVAAELQVEIEDRFHLPTSWGVAGNKLVAKIATEIGKPKGLIDVPPGEEAAFLAPLPVQMLWGVGPKTQNRLAKLGVHTIGELAALPSSLLEQRFGEHGLDLATKAIGTDNRPVGGYWERRSLSSERTFDRDIADENELKRMLRRLSEQVGYRLRKEDLAGRTVKVKIRWENYETLTRQTKLEQPTDHDAEIYQSALQLFQKEWRKGRRVRLLGVGVTDLSSPIRQLDLFEQSWEKDNKLLKAIDEIRARYGSHALRRASTLKRPKSDQKES
jgi:DNA polymerase-4